MQTDYWFSYAVLTALWFVMPSRQGLLVASYARGRGRFVPVLACISGVVLAHLAAALAIGQIALLAASVSTFVLSALSWLGGILLALFLAGSAILPDLTGPFGDNDNRREKRLPRVFLDGFAETFFARRVLVYYLAIVPHFMAASAAWQEQLSWLAAATAISALAAGLYPALAHDFFFRRLARRKVLRRKPKRGSMVSIASSAVTAGYRKIAA